MGSNPLQAIPSITQPFVDFKTAQVTLPWYRLFLTLWNRTGGTTGDTSGLPFQMNNSTGVMMTGNALNAAVLLRSGPGGPFTDTVASADSYLKAHNFPVAPSTNPSVFINLTGFNWTIAPTANVTFLGNLSGANFVIPAHSQRVMTVSIDSVISPALTIYG